MSQSITRSPGRTVNAPVQTEGNPHRTVYVSVEVESDPLRTTQNGSSGSAFPCNHPVNRHMAGEEARFSTFLGNPRWPQHRINATPRQLARAGLFYLGESDRVKCWYCDGGLQDWERDDDPWREHSKWYPTCEFVLQQKGPEFVHRISAQFPNLRRPSITNGNVNHQPPRPSHLLREVQSSVGYRRPTSSSSVIIIDPMEERRRQDEIVTSETSSTYARQARDMGFEETVIKAAVRRRIETNQGSFPSAESLIDAILSLPPEAVANEMAQSSMNESPLSNQSSSEELNAAASARELQRLEESLKCKVCRTDAACMVLLPCGHIPCCLNCGTNVQFCPICRSHVDQRVRSYKA